MNKRYNNILETIGNTPIVKINKLAPKGVNIYAKVESFNPMGSVKDRLAIGVIEDAERKGELKPGQTIVEATSGNTGISLAMVCAQKGYPLVITMAENFSIERRKLMRFLGAKVVLTPASEKGSGMVAKAEELAIKHGWWQSKQFENPANADIHTRTTANEIADSFEDIGLDYWVTGYGSGGTMQGVSRGLRQRSPSTKIMICEPDNSQVLGSGIPQARNKDGSHSESHPTFRPHLMQGWSPDFVPKLAETTQSENLIDGFIPVDGNFSLQCAKDLAQKEGIFVGITAGATFAAALEIAKTAPEGSNILCILPDTGERYLTTPLFEDIEQEMTQEEIALSKSTDGYRFDLTAEPIEEEIPKAEESAVVEMENIITKSDHSIVMFALEWCEFCWSVRKVFAEYGIKFESVDLDSVEFQANNRGGKIRTALRNKTTWNTFPQIFVDGEFIGGCTDLFDGIKDGSFMKKLNSKKIDFNSEIKTDPYSFIPKWLHSRSA
ncbi:MAG: pyridoxal-phosphate dependent enzyme [Kangiellaceae bacterium]